MNLDLSRPELVVVAIGGLGDVLLLTPFIRHFHETGRYQKIRCLCTPRAVELFDKNPFIDQVIPCETGERLFWGIPQCNREVFSPFHTFRLELLKSGEVRLIMSDGLNPGSGHKPAIEAISAKTGVLLRSKRLEIFTTRRDQSVAREIHARAGGRKAVLVSFQSALKEKDLPGWLQRGIRQRLRRAGMTLLEVRDGKLRIGRSKAPLPGLRAMSELARRCAVVLTVDSFLGHLAAAVSTPAVVLFGPSNPEVYGHPSNRNLRPSACLPCGGTQRRRQCPAPFCMRAFQPAEVSSTTIQMAFRSLVPRERRRSKRREAPKLRKESPLQNP